MDWTKDILRNFKMDAERREELSDTKYMPVPLRKRPAPLAA
nr:MAG TPA_asm: hypothetical protein [Caudoviricetes sp.]